MRLLSKMIAAAALAASVAGCAPIDITITTAFDPAAHSYINQTGTARIEGQAFLRQAGGAVVTAAGETVTLYPATPYVQELLAAVAEAERQATYQSTTVGASNADTRLDQYTRRTTADAQGNFTFSGLPAGTYIVHTRVEWIVVGQFGPFTQGGHLTQNVTLSTGQSVRLIVTR